jgi:hypothetical protein
MFFLDTATEEGKLEIISVAGIVSLVKCLQARPQEPTLLYLERLAVFENFSLS